MTVSFLLLSCATLFATTPLPTTSCVDIAMNRCCKESSSTAEKESSCKVGCKKEEDCGSCHKKGCNESQDDASDSSCKTRKGAAQKVVEGE